MDPIAQATDRVMQAGCSVLQIYQFGQSEDDHVDALLNLVAPEFGANVIDIGCGVGAVTKRMLLARPDLNVTLVNDNVHQLSMCDHGDRLLSDMHRIPVDDASQDVALVLYSIGYARLDEFAAEMARIVRPGGQLLLWDLAGPAGSMRFPFGYDARESIEIEQAFTGFRCEWLPMDGAHRNRFEVVLSMDSAELAGMARASLNLVTPIGARFTRV